MNERKPHREGKTGLVKGMSLREGFSVENDSECLQALKREVDDMRYR